MATIKGIVQAAAHKNLGEYGYKLGIEVYDENDAPVTITGDVTLIYDDPAGTQHTEIGSKSGNEAYYTVQNDDFTVSGTYRWWIKCFALDIYGPFELKIWDI